MLWVGSLIDFGLCALLELLSTLFASILLQNTFDCALCGAFGYSLYPVEVQPVHHAPAMRTPRGPQLSSTCHIKSGSKQTTVEFQVRPDFVCARPTY